MYSKTSENYLSPFSLIIYVTHLRLSPPNVFLSSPCIPPNSLKPNSKSTYLCTPAPFPFLNWFLLWLVAPSPSPLSTVNQFLLFWRTTPISTAVFLYVWQKFNRQSGGMLCRGWNTRETDWFSCHLNSKHFLPLLAKFLSGGFHIFGLFTPKHKASHAREAWSTMVFINLFSLNLLLSLLQVVNLSLISLPAKVVNCKILLI